MKKIKYLAAITALSMTVPCASAFAENSPEYYEDIPYENYADYLPEASNDVLYTVIPENNTINVVFNGDFIPLSDSPVNIDGRTKLPFRELLENIGAAVSYDESTAKVSAERNGIKIEFSLNSDIIYIDNRGIKSEVKMDSSIDIINGKTFVPVRMIAESFDLSVGWDELFRTVIITDTEEYLRIINENCGNYVKLCEMQYALNENYSSNQKISLSLNIENSLLETPKVSALNAELTSVSEKDKALIESQNTLNFSALNIIEPNIIYPDGKVDLKNVKFDFILDNDKLYLSTNLAEVIKDANPDNTAAALAASLFTPDTWLSGTLDELFTELLGMDDAQAKMISAIAIQPQSFNTALSSLYTSCTSINENSLTYAISAASQVNTMKNMFGDDKFTLTENEDGSYSFDYSFTNEDLKKYISDFMTSPEISADDIDETIEQITDMMNINMTMYGTVSDEEISSNAELSFSMDMDGIKINAEADIQSYSDIGNADLSEYELPKYSMKLSTIIKLLQSQFK